MNKEMKNDLDKLFEKGVKIFAETFHIHISGDLSKLTTDKLLKMKEILEKNE